MRITSAMLFCAMLVTIALGQDNLAKRETETHPTISVKSFGESNVLGYLGHPLGTVVRVTGVSVDGDARGRSKAESGKTLLKIDTVNGKSLEQPVEFPFFRAAAEIKKPHPGERFDYYVHEHGVFDGVVELPKSLDGTPIKIAHDGFYYRPQITIHKSNISGSNVKAQADSQTNR